MSTLLTTRFTQYQHTPLEALTGASFNQLQREVIQNLIASAALEKVALTFDPSNPLRFAQHEAELQGQIEILEYLLAQQDVISQLAANNQSEQ